MRTFSKQVRLSALFVLTAILIAACSNGTPTPSLPLPSSEVAVDAQLMVSESANRSEEMSLANAALSGLVYIYVEGVDAERVEFYLDDAERVTGPIKVASNAPVRFRRRRGG